MDWEHHAPFGWRAALSASIIAGLVFAVLDVGLGWLLLGVSPWTPLRKIAAIALGPNALEPVGTFDAGVVLVAICLHLVLSIIYGAFLALMLPAVSRPLGIVLGALYGLALYYVNFYGFEAFSPWFESERSWVSIASHAVFGAVLAYAYVAINKRTLTHEGQALAK
jgi:hypothetical protein